jgi:hypothetical protein
MGAQIAPLSESELDFAIAEARKKLDSAKLRRLSELTRVYLRIVENLIATRAQLRRERVA